MCEKKPGPRCNDKCKVRDAKLAIYKSISKTHPKHSFEYNQALAELVIAQEVYDTTPKGIQELRTKLETEPDAIHAMRYAKGKATRMMQSQALNEIETGRVNKIASLISDFDSFFSVEEIESIIQSSRENREKFIIQTLSNRVNSNEIFNPEDIDDEINEIILNSGTQYKEYLNKIKHDIIKKDGILSKDYELALNELSLMKEPSNVNLHAYKSVGFGIQKSKAQLATEINKIAALQDSSPQVVAEYFDAYLKHYKKKYSTLNSDKQPNPPKSWIESETVNTGLVNSSSSNFIPRDPATVYAIYKLRTDLEAIPDYLKLSTKITAIDNSRDGYEITQVSRSGKTIRKDHCNTDEELSRILVKDVKDSVIMMAKVPDEIYANSKNKHRFISLSDISEKHFDIYESKTSNIADFLKVNKNTLSIYSGLRKRILKTWSTKQSRLVSERLNFNPTGVSRSVALVR
jgi:hypothetical protein